MSASSTSGLPARAHGRQEVIDGLREWGEEWDHDWTLAPIALVDLGDRLLGLGKFSACGRASGVDVDLEYAQLIMLGNGSGFHEQDFVNWGQALAAAGLDPADFTALLRRPAVQRAEPRARLAV